MEDKLSLRIYKEAFDFCEKKGLIVELVRMFQIPEPERYAQLNVDEDGLSLLETVRCLFDKNRSLLFLREVETLANKNSVVIEAGIGTGILSFVAAAKGAKVYGVEINKKTFDLVSELKEELVKKGYFMSEQINFNLGDARIYEPPEKVDLLISENNYTGMFYEKQIQIVNHLVKFLKTEGKTVPQKWLDFGFLAQSEFPYKPQSLETFVPLALEGVWIPNIPLSQEFQYTDFDFSKEIDPLIDFSAELPILTDGVINTLVVFSKVLMPSGYLIRRYDCIALNNDMDIALPERKVKKGDIIKFHIKYNCGDEVDKAKIYIET